MARAAGARVAREEAAYRQTDRVRTPVFGAPAPGNPIGGGIAVPVPRTRAPRTAPGELSVRHFRIILAIIAVVSMLATSYILLAAQEAVVQREINDLEYQNAQLDEEIAGLQVSIGQGQNIQLVRQKARDELGMSDPSHEQYVYVGEIEVPGDGVAQMIRSAAYGQG